MAETSKIEWTDATWNPITGCTLVSEGCKHCYAARLAATRLRNHPSRKGLARLNAAGEAKFTGEVRLNEGWLDQPLRWRRPRRIFVCAHGDLFHESVPDEWIDRVFAVMALAPQHVFQVLTKRPERARAWFSKNRPFAVADEALREGRHLPETHPGWERGRWNPSVIRGCTQPTDWPLPNVWLGTSVEDQPTADERIPHLLATPAALRFVSAEPLLGPVILPGGWLGQGDNGAWGTGRLDWVIAGGESGPGARPMHPDWPRALRDQCAAAGVPFFFKQWGEWAPTPEGAEHPLQCEPAPRSSGIFDVISEKGRPLLNRVGKSRAGRLLDGREHQEFPA